MQQVSWRQGYDRELDQFFSSFIPKVEAKIKLYQNIDIASFLSQFSIKMYCMYVCMLHGTVSTLYIQYVI